MLKFISAPYKVKPLILVHDLVYISSKLKYAHLSQPQSRFLKMFFFVNFVLKLF